VKPFFVANWRQAHKWFTVRLSALLAVLSIVAATLPGLSTEIAPHVYPWIVFGFALAIGIGRMINQTPAAAGMNRREGDAPPPTGTS
jgi:hypothetical protein